jgi:hypothetical protein
MPWQQWRLLLLLLLLLQMTLTAAVTATVTGMVQQGPGLARQQQQQVGRQWMSWIASSRLLQHVLHWQLQGLRTLKFARSCRTSLARCHLMMRMMGTTAGRLPLLLLLLFMAVRPLAAPSSRQLQQQVRHMLGPMASRELRQGQRPPAAGSNSKGSGVADPAAMLLLLLLTTAASWSLERAWMHLLMHASTCSRGRLPPLLLLVLLLLLVA